MTRLILRDWEASAWHAGRLSAVVRLCPKANFDPAGNLSPADAVHLDGTGQGWIAWWGGAPKPETTAKIFYPTGGFRCPLGPPGQRLWIAESWALYHDMDGKHPAYLADKQDHGGTPPPGYRGWRSPATMPQHQSRSTAVHLGSQLVRVQAVTEIDAMECGISDAEGLGEACADSFKAALIVRFVKQYGQAAWDANVWVWLHRIGRA